jgi:hypothetical protein
LSCAIGEILGALFGFGGHHGPTFHPNGPPFGRSGAGQDSGPLQGETLGLPNSLKLPQPSLAGIVVPADAGCEFGSCVQIGNGLDQKLVLAGAGGIGEVICVIAEPCGLGEAIGAGVFVGTFVVVTKGIDAYRYFTKADKQSGPGTPKDRSLEGTQNQVDDMERAQKDRAKTGKRIDSIEKSKQNLKNKLKGIKSLQDSEN